LNGVRFFPRFLALLALVAGLSGCKKKNTYVHVEIKPDAAEPAGITTIDLQLALGLQTASKILTDPALKLPTDVTLQIQSGSGPLAITAIARDAVGVEVDRGTTTVQVVKDAIAEAVVQLPGGTAEIQAAVVQQPFGTVAQGQASAPVAITFQNVGFKLSGSGPLSVALGGTGATSFAILTPDACSGKTLAPGASCIVSVKFQPTTIGDFSATLTADATPGGPAVVPLTGTGGQGLAVTLSGNGTGKITSDVAGINCGAGGTNCSAAYVNGTTVVLTPAVSAGSLFVGWSGGTPACSGIGTCTVTMTQAQSVTANFRVTLCASGTTVAQVFNPVMEGCAAGGANATFANRACGAGAHVCTSNEWVQNRAGIAPLHHYWTDDALNYSIGSGPCGTSACGTGSTNCFVTTGTTYASNCGATTPSPTPMRVCAGTGGTVTDPEGNVCNWTACGFNSVSPNAYFGGCLGAVGSNTAGVLCCSGTMHQYFVNASTGNDSNPGTSASPFKTITRALSSAVSRDTVFVKPGTYSLGETFPLQVPAGVNLIGDERNRGASTGAPVKIAGSVTMGAGSTLAGFTVTSTGNGVTLATAEIVVRNNTITGNSAFGLNVSNSTSHLILLNVSTNNNEGIVYLGNNSGKAENNTITGNSFIGVEIDAPGTGDFGGGVAGSVGNNILSCNTTDFWTNIAGTVNANNNRWDHVPPTQSSAAFGNGLDLYFTSGTTVTTAGAAFAPNPCPLCSGSAVSSQVFDNTMIGCAAPGAPAAIAYTSRATLCPSYCHVCTGAEWNGHRGSIAPSTNYWTGDNPLFYISGATGSCTVSATCTAPACTKNVCTVAGGGTSDGAALICPNGGACQQTSCGLDSTVAQFFGACSTSSGATNFGFAQGTLCCCP